MKWKHHITRTWEVGQADIIMSEFVVYHTREALTASIIDYAYLSGARSMCARERLAASSIATGKVGISPSHPAEASIGNIRANIE